MKIFSWVAGETFFRVVGCAFIYKFMGYDQDFFYYKNARDTKKRKNPVKKIPIIELLADSSGIRKYSGNK